MNEKFNFSKKDNVLCVKVKGMFSEEDGQNFIQTYQNAVRSMSTKKELDMDCMELQVTPAGLIDMLTGCFEMYKQDFSKVVMRIKDNAILKMQLGRLARNVGLDLVIDVVK